ncbi:hypothetical protein FB45DRAFT_1075489 [Roridomyces roridus]|uniref:Uncharacterized protein n=1 Tax=Roridomyces roridus TaxID=1738132 RepID=A0AAD7CI31_9AGAR|nr:hypothetical protein FB45DRAFT_1075489 [Roridomyces roridus]
MPMITLFLRDGLFLFLWIMLYSTAEIIIWHSARPTLAQIPVVISAVFGGRILLNIKNLAYHTSNETVTTIELTTLSQSLPVPRRAGGNRVPWYLQTGEVKDVGSEEIVESIGTTPIKSSFHFGVIRFSVSGSSMCLNRDGRRLHRRL